MSQVREEIEKLISELPLTGSEIFIALRLRKYFPIRRGLTDIIRRRSLYVRAVDGISFSINEGEVFCLVGESGCGKTTTGRTLIGLTPPTSGYLLYRPRPEIAKQFRELGFEPVYKDYFLLNELFKNKKANKLLRRELQIIFQDPYGSLNPRFTIYSTLEEPLAVHGIAKTYEERFRYIARALEDVKLTPPEEFMKRYPHQLSGGQRQRVVIARALIL
ncbi:MAG: peptide ABC transporter ATP-binding protein, partial [Thermoprotei archaeon]